MAIRVSIMRHGWAPEMDAGEDEDLEGGRLFILWSTEATEWSIERRWYHSQPVIRHVARVMDD